jgi:hypothetical protein
MDNTSESESHVWNGTGQYYQKLQVRHLFDNEYRVIGSQCVVSIYPDYNTIIFADSFEEAIYHLQNYDSFQFDETTLWGEEGG